jgi:HK97 family phage major capsid protein
MSEHLIIDDTSLRVRALGTLTASFVIDEINVEERTVPLSFSSETPVFRTITEGVEGFEVLDHSPESVRLGRLNNGGALLVEHKRDQQIGVVASAGIGLDRRGRAVVRFGRGKQADEYFQDVRDGIRRNVSVGYKVYKFALEVTDTGDTIYRAVDWEPYEISIVSVAFDDSIGVGRSVDETPETVSAPAATTVQAAPKTQVRSMTMEIDVTANDSAQKQAVDLERKRVSELMSMGRAHGVEDLATRALEAGTSVDAFRAQVLEKIASNRSNAVSTAATAGAGNLGLSEKEVKEYSFSRAILGQLRDSGVDAGFERECSRAYAQKIGRDPRGLFVPPDVILEGARTFNKTTGTGANAIATELRPDMFIGILRNALVTSRAGAFLMPGLVGNIDIPKQTGAMTAYWFDSETHGITAASNPTIGQVKMSPKTVGAYGDISRSLLKQTTPAAEAMVRNDIAAVMARAVDLAALKGAASGGQPRGITLTSGINGANWATANTMTWAEIVAMETAVNAANALEGEFVYVMGAAMFGAAKTTVKAAGQMGFIAEGSTINGYSVLRSNQLAAGEVIFGRFDDLVIGMWGGVDLQVNPYIEALEKAGAIRLTALQDVDVAVRQPAAFTFYKNAPST